MLASDFARAADPVLLARSAGIEPDPWQAKLLRDNPRRALLLCPRQSGKSTTCGLLALHCALYKAPASIIIVSPSQAQSQLMLLNINRLHAKLKDAPGLTSESEKRLAFENGSKVLALHGDEKTIRGHSAVNLLVIDECAGIKDELISGVLPMLITTGGTCIALGTPKGLRGWFSDTWHNADEEWSRVRVDVNECPRYSKEELDKQLKQLGPIQFRQEFGLDFLTDNEAAFLPAIIETAFTDEVKPLWS